MRSALETGLGENQHLRRGRNRKGIEQRLQITVIFIEGELLLPCRKTLLKPSNSIVRPGRGVADRLLIQICSKHPWQARQPRQRHNESSARQREKVRMTDLAKREADGGSSKLDVYVQL